MNKNKTIRNLILFKILPVMLSILTSVIFALFFNKIKSIVNLQLNVVMLLNVFISIFITISYLTISYLISKNIDQKQLQKGLEAKYMLGHRIINNEITDFESAKKYKKETYEKLKEAIKNHNTANNTINHFAKNSKHLDKVANLSNNYD